MPPCCAPCVAPFVRTKGACCLPTHMVGQATSFTKVAKDPLNVKIYSKVADEVNSATNMAQFQRFCDQKQDNNIVGLC